MSNDDKDSDSSESKSKHTSRHDELTPEEYILKYLFQWKDKPYARFVVFLRTWHNESHTEVRTERRMLGPWNYDEVVTLIKELPKNLQGANLYRDVNAYCLEESWPQDIQRPVPNKPSLCSYPELGTELDKTTYILDQPLTYGRDKHIGAPRISVATSDAMAALVERAKRSRPSSE